MKKTLFALSLIATLALMGCTQTQRAKDWGGKAEMTLPAGQKLVTVSWEGHHLWTLTRPMRTNETAETYSCKETSSWGVMQGEYVIHEVQ